MQPAISLSMQEMLELGELLTDLIDLTEYAAATESNRYRRVYPVYEKWALRLAGPGAAEAMRIIAQEAQEKKEQCADGT